MYIVRHNRSARYFHTETKLQHYTQEGIVAPKCTVTNVPQYPTVKGRKEMQISECVLRLKKEQHLKSSGGKVIVIMEKLSE